MSVPGLKDVPSFLHQVLIYETTVILQLHQFWDTIQSELAHKSYYTTNIGSMRMRLFELQDDEKEVKKLRSEGLLEGWEDIKEILYY